MNLRERLRHVLWIGGGTGAGKSSIALAIAERHGLGRYDYDWHDARDHTERTRPDRHPHRAAFLAMSIDERWVEWTPRQMADNAIASFRERFDMVIEDLLAMDPGRPIVAEGFGLLPDLIAPVIANSRQAIWLLPTSAVREHAFARRGWTTIEGTSDPARARANRLARDELLTEHVRRTAAEFQLSTVEVDGARPLSEITALVARHFAPLMRVAD